MKSNTTYDLAVVGGGSGGLTAARTAKKLGASVVLIEKSKIGGDCLHTGCVPSKSLISFARKVKDLRDTSQLITGCESPGSGSIDFQKIHDTIHSRIKAIEDRSDSSEALAREGIEVARGEYSFSNPHQLVNDAGQKIAFKRCIVATGSRPIVPKLDGLEDSGYLTSDNLWGLRKLPDSLCIVGAGPIGLEIGQALAMLGVEVTILERGNTLLERLDERIGIVLYESLTANGVKFIYNASVSTIHKENDSTTVGYVQNGQPQALKTDKLMLAIGRRPNTENLGLDKIEVTLGERNGILVDSKLRTSHKNIYAVGDCVAGPLFTHWAAEQGARAAAHAVLGISNFSPLKYLPAAIFTTPEVATLGLSTAGKSAPKKGSQTVSISYQDIDKAVTGSEKGEIHVALDRKGRVIGATIIGENASELIGYFSILATKGRLLSDIAGPIQAYPTLTTGLKSLASDYYIAQLSNRLSIKILRNLRR